jgi:hypothetical protein
MLRDTRIQFERTEYEEETLARLCFASAYLPRRSDLLSRLDLKVKGTPGTVASASHLTPHLLLYKFILPFPLP